MTLPIATGQSLEIVSIRCRIFLGVVENMADCSFTLQHLDRTRGEAIKTVGRFQALISQKTFGNRRACQGEKAVDIVEWVMPGKVAM